MTNTITTLEDKFNSLFALLMVECDSHYFPAYDKAYFQAQLSGYGVDEKSIQEKIWKVQAMLSGHYGLQD